MSFQNVGTKFYGLEQDAAVRRASYTAPSQVGHAAQELASTASTHHVVEPHFASSVTRTGEQALTTVRGQIDHSLQDGAGRDALMARAGTSLYAGHPDHGLHQTF